MVDIGSGCLSYLSETFFDAFPFRTEFGVLEFSVGGGRHASVKRAATPISTREKAMQRHRIGLAATVALGLAAMTAGLAVAQKKYDPGANDSEIKIGNINPYSGPASSYGTIGRTIAAYFNKVNAEGGINGRKINFISYDDAYSPPKAVEQARKLVESDEVLLIFQSLGTP